MEYSDRVRPQPFSLDFGCVRNRYRIAINPGIRGYSNETERDNPRQTNRCVSGKELLPPHASGLILGRTWIVSVKRKVLVRDDQPFVFLFRNSSASKSS